MLCQKWFQRRHFRRLPSGRRELMCTGCSYRRNVIKRDTKAGMTVEQCAPSPRCYGPHCRAARGHMTAQTPPPLSSCVAWSRIAAGKWSIREAAFCDHAEA